MSDSSTARPSDGVPVPLLTTSDSTALYSTSPCSTHVFPGAPNPSMPSPVPMEHRRVSPVGLPIETIMNYEGSGNPNVKKLVCIMVGLPARGKTYISQRVCRFLKWLAVPCRAFNVGQYRRKYAGENVTSEFFNPKNAAAQKIRLQAATEAATDLINFLNSNEFDPSERDDVRVAIFDATNSTRERRSYLLNMFTKHDIECLFVESICNEPALILRNIREVKVSGPDYMTRDPLEAEEDFMRRMVLFESTYQTITEEDVSHCKVINVGDMVVINRVHGWLQSRIVYYVMNLHVKSRRIFMSRHGESMFNIAGRIGGDAELSPRGQQYAEALPSLFDKLLKSSDDEDEDEDPPIVVWTSTLRRTIQTARNLRYPKLQWKSLDELDAGVCDGMTYEEIERDFPEDFAARDCDKFNYRYRGGESYRDLVIRLEPVIMELERQENILIVAHQAVIRALYAYFLGHSLEDLPYVRVPLHSVICITPKAYGCEERRVRLDIEAVDTHRPRPSKPGKA